MITNVMRKQDLACQENCGNLIGPKGGKGRCRPCNNKRDRKLLKEARELGRLDRGEFSTPKTPTPKTPKPKELRYNDSCFNCGAGVWRTKSSRPEIICQPCRRKGAYRPQSFICEFCKRNISIRNVGSSTRLRFCSIVCANESLYGTIGSSEEALENKRERYRRKNRRRRTLLSRVGIGNYTLAEIAERDSYLCSCCSKPVDMTLSGLDTWGPTIDHIKPVSKGGLDTRDNVALAHRTCNTKKSATYLE